MGTTTAPDGHFWSPRVTSEFLGIPRKTITEWEREGRFPQRRKLARQAVGYLRTEIIAWAEDRPPVKMKPRRRNEPETVS